jgi:hypothetical protein
MYNTTYNFLFILNIILGDCSRSDYTFVADLRLCLKFYIDLRTQPEAISKCLQDGAPIIYQKLQNSNKIRHDWCYGKMEETDLQN